MNVCLLRALLLLLLCTNTPLFAQQVRSVKGSVQTMEGEIKKIQPLTSASIVVMEAKDSTFVKGTVTDKNGHFSFQYPAKKGTYYLLKASFMGMQPVFRTLKDTVTVNAGTIVLKDDDIYIDEVVVTGKLKEIVTQGDTTVINASAYKTPAGAYLEDLVKRIPGLVYNKTDHSLTYNGQAINEINVNGEAFFSGNKKTALENLPADLIGKLRVYNKRSEEEKFTGIERDEKNYVLDLETKKELNSTWFASAKVGYGNKQKKDLEGQANYFRKDGENFSLIARSTNRNQNSTYKDNINNSLGLNMTHKFSKDFSLMGNIQYNQNRSGNRSSSYQEQYLKGGNQYSSSVVENSQNGESLSSMLRLNWKIDKRTQVTLSGSFGSTPNRSENENQNATFDKPPHLDLENPFEKLDEVADSVKVNHSDSRSAADNHSNRYEWSAGVMRRLNEKGSTLTFSLQSSDSRATNKNFSLSKTTYFRLENKLGNDSVLYRNQYLQSPTQDRSWSAGVAFTQPFGKTVHLQAGYTWSNRNEDDDRNTYDLSFQRESEKDEFGQLPSGYEAGYVDSLSNRSRSRTNEHQLRLSVAYRKDEWNIHGGLTVVPQQRTIDRKVGMLYADTTMHTLDFRPSLWASWGGKGEKLRLNLNYNGNTRQPSLSDLMPLTDNSNPLYITRGNKDLKQMFTHDLRLGFQHPSKGISANVGGRLEQNSVTRVMTYDQKTGGRETYPVNINGNWGTNANADWWKRMGQFTVRLNAMGNYDNRVSLVNENQTDEPERSATRNTGLNCETNLSYQPKWGGIDLSASWRFQHSLNSLNENSTYTRNYDFKLESYADFPFGLQLRTDAAYALRSGTNMQGTDKDEVLWNAGATWRFLKKKEAELSAYWTDILGEQNSYGRFASSDGFYESYNLQIRGYFIVTFKYNFRLMM